MELPVIFISKLDPVHVSAVASNDFVLDTSIKDSTNLFNIYVRLVACIFYSK